MGARWAISLLFFVDGAAIGSWAPHIATVKQSLHLSAGVLGTALLASSIGAILTMPFASYGIHRVGSRVSSVIGGLLLCGVLPLLVLAPSVPLLALSLFFLGVFNGQMDVGMNVHSMAIQDRFDRPIISAVHGWFSIGGFAGGGGAALAATLGVAPVVHLAIAGGLLSVLILSAFRFLLPAAVDAGHEGPRFALPRGPLALLGVITMVAFLSEGAIWDWTAVYLRTVLHSTASLGALGFGLFSLGMAGARFLGDGWIHRFGRLPVLQTSAVAAAVGLWLALVPISPWMAIAGFALAGLGIANIVPILFRASSSFPRIPASVGLSAVTTCGYAGFLIGPPSVGFVADLRSLSFAMGLIALLLTGIAVSARAVINRNS